MTEHCRACGCVYQPVVSGGDCPLCRHRSEQGLGSHPLRWCNSGHDIVLFSTDTPRCPVCMSKRNVGLEFSCDRNHKAVWFVGGSKDDCPVCHERFKRIDESLTRCDGSPKSTPHAPIWFRGDYCQYCGLVKEYADIRNLAQAGIAAIRHEERIKFRDRLAERFRVAVPNDERDVFSRDRIMQNITLVYESIKEGKA